MTSGIYTMAGALIGFSAPAVQASPNWAWGIVAGLVMGLIGVTIDINER